MSFERIIQPALDMRWSKQSKLLHAAHFDKTAALVKQAFMTLGCTIIQTTPRRSQAK